MNKTQARQENMLHILRDQGTGVVSITDDKLSALLGVSNKTIQRDLRDMNYRGLIIKETRLITLNGNTRKQRDIIVPGEPQRRFTLDQHRFLSNKENHMIFVNEYDEVIWLRRPDGINFERCFEDKEFKNIDQAYNWMYHATASHNKKYKSGDRYTSRVENI